MSPERECGSSTVLFPYAGGAGSQQIRKVLPALTIPAYVLSSGLDIIADSVRSVMAEQKAAAVAIAGRESV
jgi:hypothetical protein